MKAELSDVKRAAAIYTKRSLAFYDWWVLKISNERFWKCPTELLLEFYNQHRTSNHLEVGVGTGYFLKNSLKENEQARIVLLDINEACLERTSKAIARYKPELCRLNVMESFQIEGDPFDSVAINYLLHCLPGTLEFKSERVFDHLLPYLRDDGIIFGSTILGADVDRTLMAKFLMRLYNGKGIFSNKTDSLGGIMEALSARFKTFNVEVHGCVVLFWGRGVKASYRESHPARHSVENAIV